MGRGGAGVRAYGREEVRRERRNRWIEAVVRSVPISGTMLVTATPERRPIAALFFVSTLLVSLVWEAARRRPSPLGPLLARCDDVRLVPLWLEAMDDAKDEVRAALRDRLTKRLPDYWTSTDQPLSDCARTNLLSEVRRLRDREWDAADIAFVTAVLICLDPDPARGIVPDAEYYATLDEFQQHRHDPTVQAATEDALLRLGRRS